ncbi:hypothetical protein [Novosphingobium sp. PASSN1]|uniref:hypothetical protein n=1 Tax=Novosphingobium sp. PASSN1 TaxID=2015561 RepID=UPI0025E12EC6|nr:hypothetical protein [Novosphingobium sp. PASSN1]
MQKFVPTPVSVPSQNSANPFPVNAYRALIDTGAQRTCLSHATIAREGLASHAKRPIQNVHSVQAHLLYWINVGFIFETDRLDGGEPIRSFFGVEFPVEAINIADNHSFDVILGMDVLQNFDFEFRAEGQFILNLG